MISVIIYEISIISCYCHLNVLLTTITYTTIFAVMKFLNYIRNKDLQQFSTAILIDTSFEIYVPYSHILNHLPI